MICDKELEKLGFKRTHEIVFKSPRSNLPEFYQFTNHPSLRKPSVYLWVTPINLEKNCYDVLYVGKAGYGTTRRFSQHKGGFKNNKPGSNSTLIIEKLQKDKIFVYGKVSDNATIFGVTVSRYSLEEEALCELLSPLWNRATFPNASKVTHNKLIVNDQHVKVATHTSQLNGDTLLWFESLNQVDQLKFVNIIKYTESVDKLKAIPQKNISGYSAQPLGFNNIPMITYGEFGKTGRIKPNSWLLRVPKRTDGFGLTLFIPCCFMADNLNASKVLRHGVGKNEFFYPADIDDFLKFPHQYVDWGKSDGRSTRDANCQ
jgi:hypothetical protein